jgi:hypothetical protein
MGREQTSLEFAKKNVCGTIAYKLSNMFCMSMISTLKLSQKLEAVP